MSILPKFYPRAPLLKLALEKSLGENLESMWKKFRQARESFELLHAGRGRVLH